MKKKVYVSLANGIVLEGYRFGAETNVQGELVFSTSMVGYIETLTDPSNYGKIIMQTFPLIGNYGVMKSDMESDRAWAKAYLVREICQTPSNFRSEDTLDNFLKEQGVVGVYGIDTRQLTKILREEGTMHCYIGDAPLQGDALKALQSRVEEDCVKAVSDKAYKKYTVDNAKRTLVLWDMGGRHSQIQTWQNEGCSVQVVPATASAEEVLGFNADGVVIGEGPGNPAVNAEIILEIQKVLGKTPVLGVGLGHQLIALALGAQTQKQKYGHMGANQPVKCVANGKVYISTQNHNYEVLADTLSQGETWFVNVNDGSCEGLVYPELSALSVQFDPASCGIGHTENLVYNSFFQMTDKENEHA